jgi:hypothetical protein
MAQYVAPRIPGGSNDNNNMGTFKATKEIDVFAVNKTISKKDTSFTKEDIAKIKETGIKLALFNSTPNGKPFKKGSLLKKRFEIVSHLV